VDRAHLKQRIVGAIVLVALGVIFIPMILNRDASLTGISGSNIPKKPDELGQLEQQPMPSPPVVPAQPGETRQLVDKDSPTLPAMTATLTQQDAPPGAATGHEATQQKSSQPDKPATQGWVVQVASFTDRGKALRFRDRLRKAGYTCFVESITRKHGALYRVRVGPVVKREEAKALQVKINKRFKLKDTLVMAHP
jgi:DedD protein